MSPEADAEAPPERRGALGVWLGLVAVLLIAGLAFVATRSWAAPLDPRAELERLLAFEELPFELAPVAALRLEAGGERVVKLEPPAVEEAPRVEAPALEPGPQAAPPPFEWAEIAVGPAGSAPVQVFVIARAKGSKPAALDAAVRTVEWKDLRDVGAQGGRVPLEKGELGWHGWVVDWVIERELEQGGTFRDWARADLSADGPALLLVARWGRGLPATKETLERLIGALAPHAEAQAPSDAGAAGEGEPR
jgi:hypothetical protein